MQENKDPAIRLFGQKIPFPGEAAAPSAIAAGDALPAVMDVDREEEKESQQQQDTDFVGELKDEEENEQGDKVQLINIL